MTVADFDAPAAVELAEGGGRKPRLLGRALPYGVASMPSITDGRRYRFHGPPENDLADVVAVREHDDNTPIGLITGHASGDGLDTVVELLPTTAGRDAHAEAVAKVRNGFSASFDVLESEEADDGVIDVRRWTMRHLGHVRRAAFGDQAQAIAASTTREATMPAATEQREATVDLAPITERLDQIEARMTAVPAERPRQLSVPEAFRLQLEESAKQRRLLALADVVQTTNTGVIPAQWSSEVIGYLDRMRYMFQLVGKVPFPTAGTSLTFPVIGTHTLVGPRGAQKSEIPSRALTTTPLPFTAQWFAGGVDVALELIWQSDPAIFPLVVDDLLAQYAAVTDQALTTATETAATPSGAVLDFSSYGALVAGLLAASEDIRAVTGQPGDRVSMTTPSWSKLIGMVDADGRRILASGGATNSDGSASLVSTTVDVGGILVGHNPRAAEDVQFNIRSARVAEKPPVTVQSDNVALMGRDVGVLGAIIPLPLQADGIIAHSLTAARETEAEATRTSRKR